MNSKRAIWKLLLAGAGVGLFVTNCTIQSASDDGTAGDNGTAATGDVASGSCTPGTKVNGCTCKGNVIGNQTCLADGTYGACSCASSNGDAGASSSNGGASSVGGSTTSGGNASTSEAGSAGEAGAAGLHIDPTDCTGCLAQLCAPEWTACQAEDENNPLLPPDAPDEYCFGSDKKPDTGQFELITDCITMARASGVANREAVRACGASIGVSSNPNDNPAFSSWPPAQMSPATEELMNCMADLPNPPTPMPGAWATDSANFPDGAPPKPWDDGTCAKLSCTSQLTP